MKRCLILLGLIILVSGCIEKPVEEYCTHSESGEKLSLSEARQIALNSECSQGELKDVYICNENTGTWWIDLNLEKEHCNPACVVDVVTKRAEINWRCTGLLLE